ncbi:excisionase family DNA binding protein [Microbacterium marinum]|uniref:Excisionase family DNA binding protein n=1 Tax=Microbacterium marinum TaxID=421115 RepID=A0A7W7BQS0_9MICO|nr:helix-turn-helix domain-containing protein [Microbacterium marinum]MBB4667108.1 excisionase family DNA binding protein [Microbacterium marinum]
MHAVEPDQTPTTLAPRWGTIEDVMAHLKVSRDTVRRMIARQEIQARRFGPRLIRIDLNQLDASSTPVVLTEKAA